MNNKEALQATLGGIELSSLAIDKALIDAGLIATGEYDSKQAIDACALELLYAEFTKPDVQEGGYGITRPDFAKLQARLLYLAKSCGRQDVVDMLNPKPTVRAVSLW